MTLTYTAAFLGGALSLLAPCGAMLLPAFFTYSFAERSKLFQRTLVFLLGLITVLVPLGFTFGSFGQFIHNYRAPLTITIGVIVIIAGIITALAIPLPHIPLPGFITGSGSTKRVRDRSSGLAVYLLGISYGAAGIGCSGPILGAVLGFSAATLSPLGGALTMFSYALGMALPIFVLAALWQVLNVKNWWRPRPVRFLGRDTTVGSLISGIIFILMGALLIVTRGNLSFGILSASSQVNIESRIVNDFAAIPNYLFLAIIIVVVAIIATLAYMRRTKRKQEQLTQTTDSANANCEDADNS